MTALAHPFDWHLDIFWTVAIPALVVAYVLATRSEENRPTRRQRQCFTLGVVALVVAFMWPLADLAARWSLLALVAQRLLLMLAVPPLLVAGTPRPIIVRLTRPAAVDAVLRLAVKPIPAVVFVTVVAVGTLDHGTGQPGRPLGRRPRGNPARRAALGFRPVGPGPHRAARRKATFRRRTRWRT